MLRGALAGIALLAAALRGRIWPIQGFVAALVAIAILARARSFGAGPLATRLAGRGYDGVSPTRVQELAARYGVEAVNALPPWSQLESLPGVDPDDQLGSVERVLAMTAWGCEARHLPLRLLGYRELTEAQADRLIEKHGADSFRQLRREIDSRGQRAAEGLSEFDYLDDALCSLLSLQAAERELAEAERAGDPVKEIDLPATPTALMSACGTP